jgi:DedD protein
MDQSLKARLIGATVLVTLAVLLIPELLSGRKAVSPSAEETAGNDRRTFTIDIGKQGGTMSAPAATRPRPAPVPVEAPVPALRAPERGTSDSDAGHADTPAPGTGAGVVQRRDASDPPRQSAPAVAQGSTSGTAATAVQPEATPAPPTAGPAASGAFFVQVGAFSSADSARKLVAQLEADGFQAQVAPVSRGGKTLHRVRVGPAASRAAAQQLGERLKARGLPASLVKSD